MRHFEVWSSLCELDLVVCFSTAVVFVRNGVYRHYLLRGFSGYYTYVYFTVNRYVFFFFFWCKNSLTESRLSEFTLG